MPLPVPGARSHSDVPDVRSALYVSLIHHVRSSNVLRWRWIDRYTHIVTAGPVLADAARSAPHACLRYIALWVIFARVAPVIAPCRHNSISVYARADETVSRPVLSAER
jgi:hypothetical protein